MKFQIFALLVASLFTSSLFSQPDVSVFTRYSAYEDIKISPDGTHIAFTQNKEGKEFLLVYNLSDMSGLASISFGSDVDIYRFDWVNDERILISPGRNFQGQLDYKNPTGEIFGIDADGKNFEMLFGYQAGKVASGKIKVRESIRAAGDIVDLLPDDPRYVIVQSIGYGVDGEFNEAWRMDVKSGALRKLAKSPIRNGRFITNANHEIEYLVGSSTENIGQLYHLDKKKGWELIASEKEQDFPVPVAPYGSDGKILVSKKGGDGTTGMSIWTPAENRFDDVFHHPDVDIANIFFDYAKNPWAIAFHDHFPDYFYPEPTHPFAILHQKLRAQFQNYNVNIIDQTADMGLVVVSLSSPTYPGDFLVADVATGKLIRRLPKYPDFPNEALSPMDPVEFQARDGQMIRAYLTTPVNSAGKQLPLVVLPHGGPHGIYDTWSYQFEVQLLASRGYAVLQVNFRGSGGRGVKFLESGYGEWGASMQNDITDAVLWATSEQIADPNRMCIMGGSYGAYAALTEVYQEPDLFKCAVGMSGVYDLNLMFKEGDIADAQRGLSYLRKVLGEDEELLDSRSPTANADKIKANVMLIHGKQDERAPYEHALRMKSALEDVGKKVEWIAEYGEMHGINSEENRVLSYTAVLDFLDANIGSAK